MRLHSFLVASFRPDFKDGDCEACRAHAQRMYLGYCQIRKRYRRRVAHTKHSKIDWESGGRVGDWGIVGVCGDGERRGRKTPLGLATARHACDFGERPSWRPWYFIHPSLNRADHTVMPKHICLEVQVKVLVPVDVRDLWTAKIPIRATLPFRRRWTNGWVLGFGWRGTWCCGESVHGGG